MLVNKYYFDWFNEHAIEPFTRGLGMVLWRDGDQVIIDGAMVNGSSRAIGLLAVFTRQIQTGFLYSYAFWMIIGLVVMLGWFLLRT